MKTNSIPTTTPAHSPLPWSAQSAKEWSQSGRHDDERWTVHLNGMPLIAVVEQYRGEAEHNAKLIVRAVNHHAQLVEALEETTGALKEARRYLTDQRIYEETGAVQLKARAVLASVKEATP
jgi:hypothetical protein